MSVGWFRQRDGISHRLHDANGWSGLYLTGGMTRTEPLLTVSAARLQAGLRYILPAHDSSAGGDFSGLEVHFARQELFVSAGGPNAVRGVVLPSSITSPYEGTFLIDSTDIASTALTGEVRIRLGTNANWDACVVFDGHEQDVVATARRAISTHRWKVCDAPGAAVTVQAADLADAAAQIASLETVTLAAAPERLIVRGPEGLIAAVDGTLSGDPVQASVPAASLALDLTSPPTDAGAVAVALWPDPGGHRLVFGEEDRHWLFRSVRNS